MLAGAGTGKTRTLTAGMALRIAEQGIRPDRVLCVTFTNKAAIEVEDRIGRMLAGCKVPRWVGIFHGLGARQLRAEPEVGGLRKNFDILDTDDSKRLVRRIVKAMNLREADEAGPDERDPVKMICGLIGKLKDQLVPDEEATQGWKDRVFASGRPRPDRPQGSQAFGASRQSRRSPWLLPPSTLRPIQDARTLSAGTLRRRSLSISGSTPTRTLQIARLDDITRAVAAFGGDLRKADPEASFAISVNVAKGQRKPHGFDAADKANGFGQDAFLRSDVGADTLHRELTLPVVPAAA